MVAATGSIPPAIKRKLDATIAGRRWTSSATTILRRAQKRRAFLAHSFGSKERILVSQLKRSLASAEVDFNTGAKPQATSVSSKVLGRIDECVAFIALVTTDRNLPRPSPWVISELGYAARKPRVVLLESGIETRELGGIQGDIEYIRFHRDRPLTAFARAAASAKRALG